MTTVQTPESARRVVVTGGCGYVGSHLTDLLTRAGAKVLVVDDLSLGRVDNLNADIRGDVDVARLDIRDAERVKAVVGDFAPEALFHLAAIHYIPACDRDPRLAISVNVEGTQSVFEACATAPSLRSVVIASTGAVYAPDHDAHHETSLLGPTDIYGLTKLWSEQLAGLFGRKSSCGVGIARLFNVFGPGETNPHLIPTVISQLQRSPKLHLGNLTTTRDYIYVEDVATGLNALSVAVAHGESITCNFSREDAISGEVVVQTVGTLLGLEPQIVTDASRVRVSDRPVLLSDTSRARELLNWRANIGLEEGLRRAIERPVAAGVEIG